MLFVKDNTIADPTDITGIILTGDAYLVAPEAAADVWIGKEDQIATWGGSTWSFFEPAAGTLYQVTGGPNEGRIYERTTVSSRYTNLVVNPELVFEIPDALYPNWTLIETAGGTAVWNAGNYVLLNSTTTGDIGGAKTTFTCVPGLKYKAVINTDSITAVGPGSSVLEYVLRNGATVLATVEIVDAGDTEVYFTALGTNYSIEVRVNSVGAAAAEAWLRSIDVFRQAELVANTGFTTDFTSWTNPVRGAAPFTDLWTRTAKPEPWTGQAAFGNVDYSAGSHSPFPALRQTVTGLQIGTYYRIALTSGYNPAHGTLSVALDGATIVDVPGDTDRYDYYFKASATSHSLEFPLTKAVTMTPLEAYIDDISMMAALWVAGPVVKGRVNAVSTVSCAVTGTRSFLVAIAAVASVVCTPSRSRAAIGTAAAAGAMSCETQVSRRPFINPLIAGVSSMVVDAGVGVYVAAHIAAAAGVRVFPDNPYYTAAAAIDAITELLSASSCSCASDGCGPIQKEALGCLNAAMQRLSATGREWGFVSNVALTLGPGVNQTGEIALPADVVSVRRCVFRPATDDNGAVFGSFPLRPLSSRHEVEAYRASSGRDLWPLTSAESALAPYNLPIGYFTEGEDLQNGQPNGPPQLRLLLAPVFNSARTWKIDVQCHIQPPRLTCMSLLDGTRLPVPHRFAETLLIPLAKYYAMANRWFRRPDLAESIKSPAQDALMLTGEYQPANPEAERKQKGAPAK